MPELPDVEIFKDYFNSTALHHKIAEVEVLQNRLLENISKSKFESSFKNKSFNKADRYGKHLLAELNKQEYLQLHFGMTGFLKYFKKEDEKPRHTVLLIKFSNDYNLAFACQRLLGKISLENSIEEFRKRNDLGIDAMDISIEKFKEKINKTNKAVKSLLMDQSEIAGIGNIYADEILFKSKINPKKSSKDISDKEIERIHKNISRVLSYAIEHKANPKDFARSYLLPNRKKGENCPRCKSNLNTEKIAGRTTYYCPQCQT